MATKQTVIRLSTTIVLLVAALVAVEAQEPTRVWRLGFLGPGSYSSGDPLARPGGNVTGLTDIAPGIVGKRLELLREAMPGITRIAVLWNPANPSAPPQMKDTVAVARSMGLFVRSPEWS
jgi:putative tryptophan/tyrosine transport system substrate-binding protein